MESTLEKLDNYFAGKKRSDIYGIYVIVFLVIFFIFYLTIFDPANEYLQNMEAKYQEVMNLQTVDAGKIQQQINTDAQVLKSSKNDLETITNNNAFLIKGLRSISDNSNRAENNQFINYISQQALEYNIGLSNIINNTKPFKPFSIGKTNDIQIVFNAKFHDLLKFVNTLEQSDLIIDVHSMDINASKNKLNGSMNIISWGIKYQ